MVRPSRNASNARRRDAAAWANAAAMTAARRPDLAPLLRPANADAPDGTVGGEGAGGGQHVRLERGGMREMAMAGRGPGRGRVLNAAGALYRPDAPGAALDGKQGSLGELVQAAFRASNGTGPAIVNASMSERIPAEGGALVGEELRSDLMLSVLEQAIIRPRATVLTMTEQATRVPVLEEGSDASGSVFGGLNFTWTEEGAALASSVASYGLDVLRAR